LLIEPPPIGPMKMTESSPLSVYFSATGAAVSRQRRMSVSFRA
jgi:hypothetical protein